MVPARAASGDRVVGVPVVPEPARLAKSIMARSAVGIPVVPEPARLAKFSIAISAGLVKRELIVPARAASGDRVVGVPTVAGGGRFNASGDGYRLAVVAGGVRRAASGENRLTVAGGVRRAASGENPPTVAGGVRRNASGEVGGGALVAVGCPGR